jgi:signal transduction histidine kinase
MTMKPELCILICEHLHTEAEEALATEGFDRVVAVAYSADCDRPPNDPQPIIKLVEESGCSSAVILGGSCLERIRKPLAAAKITLHETEHCLELLVNKSIVDNYIAQGVHILTPGMLRQWKDKTTQWDFQGDQAKHYFNESVSRFVLLDTGVGPDATKALKEFAQYAGLSTETLSVGIDLLRWLLRDLVYSQRLRGHEETLRRKDQQFADQAMMLDLMGRLTSMWKEDQIIEGVLELFSMLCAPREILFAPIGNDETASLFTQPSQHPNPDVVRERLLKVEGEQPVDHDGFCLPIHHQNVKLGVLEVTGLAFPEHRDRYLNQTIQIIPVIGLALSNARTLRERERDGEKISSLNKNLKQRLTELNATNEELEAFTYSVSHDLRSPLRAIDGFSAALVKDIGDSLNDKPLHYLQRIRSGAERMGQLIDDLLKLSRSTRGELVREKCDISAIAHDVIKALRAKEPERDVDIQINEGLVAEADARFVQVVLENLLGNAWKYTGRSSNAHISVIRDDESIVVGDNGAGFDMAYAERLFQPFQRLHDDKDFEGSGIGLSTVKRIIQRHGGTISAKSTPGQGAHFRFTLEEQEVTP